MNLPWLLASPVDFPPTENSLEDPNGLLAAGGDLSPEWLLAAYQKGIFPWYCEPDPILWWSPAPRMVLFPDQLHISRSLRKALRKCDFQVTINQDFEGVVLACSEPRKGDTHSEGPGTWITAEMIQAYVRLRRLGQAHSVEVWREGTLIGGIYGIAINRVFFGESMFSRATNGSKIAMAYLADYLLKNGYKLLDCQVYNDHLDSMGSVEIERGRFESLLKTHGQLPNPEGYTTIWQARSLPPLSF